MDGSSSYSSRRVFLKVKRSRRAWDTSCLADDDERIVLLSGTNKRARNVCVLVERNVPSSELQHVVAKKRGLATSYHHHVNKLPRILPADRVVASSFDPEMDEALWQALMEGRFERVLVLIEQHGRSPDAKRSQSPDGATALIAACRHGNLPVVNKLISLGADPELTDNYHFSPMQHAENFAFIQAALREAIDSALFDLYVVEQQDEAEGGSGSPKTAMVVSHGVLHVDPLTGEFVELVHDVNESEADEQQQSDDSDSNEEGYYENKLDDDEENDDDDDGDSREGLY
jgi:hypothetical protein